MKACQGQMGRVFIIRLEDGDVIPDCIERFAEENGISAGQVTLVGGITGGEVVVGPKRTDGLLALDESGKPKLHIHGALGRSGQTLTGCLRPGVTTWLVVEAILYEVLGVKPVRVRNDESGFPLLEPGS